MTINRKLPQDEISFTKFKYKKTRIYNIKYIIIENLVAL